MASTAMVILAGFTVLCGAVSAAAVEDDRATAQLVIAQPGLAPQYFAGLMAARMDVPEVSSASVFLPGFKTDSDQHGLLGDGCTEEQYKNIKSQRLPFAVFVNERTCSTEEKALHASKAGAAVTVVVSDDDDSYPLVTTDCTDCPAAPMMGVLANIGNLVAKAPEGAITVDVAKHEIPRLFNPSQCILIALATSLVIAGAFSATGDLRSGSPIAPASEEVVEIDNKFPVHFFATGAIMLAALSFAADQLTCLVTLLFCLSGAAALAEFGDILLRYHMPRCQQELCYIPFFGTVDIAQVFAAMSAGAMVVGWLQYRTTEVGWIFQDIIGAGFLCFVQRIVRVPDLQIATVTLSMLFLFDLLRVFVSPSFVDVGMTVALATRGHDEPVPLMLRVPALGNQLAGESLLCFGDVALPGLLVSYLRRYDMICMRALSKGYFLPSVIGYFLGTVATTVAMHSTQKSQPAMMFLVPFTLGTTLVLGVVRNELGPLWSGIPSELAAGESLMSDEYGQELSLVSNSVLTAGQGKGPPESFNSAGSGEPVLVGEAA